MTVIWPIDLPPSAILGWSEVADSNMIPGVQDKGRRKYTKARHNYSVSIMVNLEQLEIFTEFWEEGTKNGIIPFYWERPSDHAEARFISLTPPQVVHVDGVGAGGIYRISLSLKEL